MILASLNPINKYLKAQVHIAPLVVFRILFGVMMLASIIRFMLKGWVYDLYIKPQFYFSYFGFEWVKPLGEIGMYSIFIIMGISALLIMLGFLYRFSALIFFLSFTYVELIDKSNYLNHYYFVSIIALLMIFLPAAKYFSLDAFLNPDKRNTHINKWIILVIQLQLGIVYFYAGLAKLNADWLFDAQPLRIWLQARTDLPLIGFLMDKLWIAYLFSWFGAIYDLSIPFLLLFKRTRLIAFGLVVIFHVMTALLFPIGMFPYIMIISTLIFFSEKFHLSIIHRLSAVLHFFKKSSPADEIHKQYDFKPHLKSILILFLSAHFIVQLFLPFRYILYPGKLFWTEQGYRFSWRVMLMEKAGKAFFYVTDKATKKSGEVMMNDYLTPNQEKMMATQPDMILQYAHFLKEKQQQQGMKDPEIRVSCYVTLNGSGSRLFIDKELDLTTQKESFENKEWILPFEK